MHHTNFKLVCSDIDGTLLNKEKSLSAPTIMEFERLHKMGVKVILSSSRMPQSIRSILDEANLDEPIIAYNGALIELSHEHSVIFDKTIPLSLSKGIYDICNNSQVHCSLYYKDLWFPPLLDYWTERETKNTRVNPIIKSYNEVIEGYGFIGGFHKIMCMGEESKIENLIHNLEAKYSELVSIYRTKNTYIEISPIQTNKYQALVLLCNYLGISIRDVIAFGDNYNDVEMIKNVGLGVAVSNAVQEVKDAAQYITLKNTDDGVADALSKIIT